MPSRGEIVIYQTKDKKVQIEVKLEQETVWLTQKQIAEVFKIERSVITKHLRNIFKNKELSRDSVCAKIAHTALDGKVYQTTFYNLDVIISVGYRVNSNRATQFRIWATKVLKDYIVRGYSVNEKRLLKQTEKLRELQNTISFLHDKSHRQLLENKAQAILNLLGDYSKSLSILEQYDTNKLEIIKGKKPEFILTYTHCLEIIIKVKTELLLRKEAGELFGQDIDRKFESIVKNLYQTFAGKELYESIGEKAAHLLYFSIKDHPFVDGNKRIASLLFIYFLERNEYLFKENGERKINDNALVALALLIAVSEPKEKDVMIKIITNLLK